MGALSGVFGLALSLTLTASPAAAYTTSGSDIANAGATDSSTSVSMQWNCDELTDADRQKALDEDVRMCGLNEPEGAISTRAANTNNCGTAYIYTGQAGGRARVDYSLHSTAGIITGRGLDVWWGPTSGGSKYDFGGFWGTGFYGNQTDIGYAMKGKPFGATMSGWVSIAGWTLTCNVYVNEPTRNL
ncbi:hypothetical protein [Microbacterium sp. Leaf179]|jgi:hypothetical protein|uniref:hypothetical protein n=1 Tax=Microbacterium sp. Leaf179 TaxID=1736288 RepID=UPI0012E3C32F|nr:hypothetical protein [Microbacterium sp. Leaf179]